MLVWALSHSQRLLVRAAGLSCKGCSWGSQSPWWTIQSEHHRQKSNHMQWREYCIESTIIINDSAQEMIKQGVCKTNLDDNTYLDDELDEVQLADYESDGTRVEHDRRTKTKRIMTFVGLVALLLFVVIFPTAVVLSNRDDDTARVDDVSSYQLTNDEVGVDAFNGSTTEASVRPTDATVKLQWTRAKEDKDKDGEKFYVSTDGPFNVTLRLFDKFVAQGYADDAELERDITNAAYFVVNQVIKANIGVPGYDYWYGGRIPRPVMSPGDEADFTAEGSDSGVADDLDDYGTNNQEEDVEEGDVVVSDGEFGESVWSLTSFVARHHQAFRHSLFIFCSLCCVWRLPCDLGCEKRHHSDTASDAVCE